MVGDDQRSNPATGDSEDAHGRERPDPAAPSPASLTSGPAPEVLPGISAGVQRDTGRIRHLELRRGRHRRGSRCFCAHPVTQGAQLLDRQDLVRIRLIHNAV